MLQTVNRFDSLSVGSDDELEDGQVDERTRRGTLDQTRDSCSQSAGKADRAASPPKRSRASLSSDPVGTMEAGVKGTVTVLSARLLGANTLEEVRCVFVALRELVTSRLSSCGRDDAVPMLELLVSLFGGAMTSLRRVPTNQLSQSKLSELRILKNEVQDQAEDLAFAIERSNPSNSASTVSGGGTVTVEQSSTTEMMGPSAYDGLPGLPNSDEGEDL